jgi:hypothetical protein
VEHHAELPNATQPLYEGEIDGGDFVGLEDAASMDSVVDHLRSSVDTNRVSRKGFRDDLVDCGLQLRYANIVVRGGRALHWFVP